MRFNTLAEWLDWQATLSPKSIDLGLDRVTRVYRHLNLSSIAKQIITVAGTNGKGSTVAYYEAWFSAAGQSVGSYTSPHILRYNERTRINQQMVSDRQLIEAFDAIDQARGEIRLTYFEFGTLAALYLFARNSLDVVILEVGLGGRLDAVNIIDPDLAHITPIGLDHQEWLGDSREQIALEKAGILRDKGRAVINDFDPAKSLINRLSELECDYSLLGRDYRYSWISDTQIEWSNAAHKLTVKVPLAGDHQAMNVSGVLAGLAMLGCLESDDSRLISERLQSVFCPGRLQLITHDHAWRLYVDVGHNEDAARALNLFLQQLKSREHTTRVVVLLGMLRDKSVESYVSALADTVDEWWALGLQGERGQSADQLCKTMSNQVPVSQSFEQIESAISHALSSLGNQDILLVTGSFISVEAVLNTSYITLQKEWINN